MKPFRFHREALAEAKAAAERYVAINPQLGQRFHDAIDLLVREVGAQPTLLAFIAETGSASFFFRVSWP